ncbi:MAG TPA: sigma-70 family RNA polymerase sigma factor [Tepidisphaeraceae bacterium]
MKADAAACCDEQHLVRQLRRGERAALEQLVAMYRPMVSRLVARLSGWSGEADDLVQDVFVKAISAAGKFRGESKISTWLTSIAINVCRQHHRTRMFRAEFWKRWKGRPERMDADASQTLERRERIERVTQAVRRLRGNYREVVVLHYLEGMSSEEIGGVLGVTRNTVEVRLHRAREQLRGMLGSIE